MKLVDGNIVDILGREIFPGVISIENNIIKSITRNSEKYDRYILPGFIDAHVHIESSMLIPKEFSSVVIKNGTVAIINDPHEIANVLGIPGISFMIENSKESLVKTFFTIPSCVPSTAMDYSGGKISALEIENLIDHFPFIGLSEVMDVPGVLNNDPKVKDKIEIAVNHNLIIDGHAPQLKGKDLEKYIAAGISTDHECIDMNEALEKINLGMNILIREGSAAKNYEALKYLLKDYSDHVMFCTDDSHPSDLIHLGHIDKIVRRAIKDGFDLYNVLKIACINPIKHYRLDIGFLRINDPADFIVVNNLDSFDIISVFINGEEKYHINSDQSKIDKPPVYYKSLNNFKRKPIQKEELIKSVQNKITCIGVLNNEIITKKIAVNIPKPFQNLESDIERDILKIVYLNRYENKPPQIAYITGIGLKKGAFASSVSHDSHNIIAVGCKDHDLLMAINTVIAEKGGLCSVIENETIILPLPIAGIMTSKSAKEVSLTWDLLIEKLKMNGCVLDSPFMTLSFMALIVIPELKIGEKGLFEYSKFDFISES